MCLRSSVLPDKRSNTVLGDLHVPGKTHRWISQEPVDLRFYPLVWWSTDDVNAGEKSIPLWRVLLVNIVGTAHLCAMNPWSVGYDETTHGNHLYLGIITPVYFYCLRSLTPETIRPFHSRLASSCSAFFSTALCHLLVEANSEPQNNTYMYVYSELSRIYINLPLSW